MTERERSDPSPSTTSRWAETSTKLSELFKLSSMLTSMVSFAPLDGSLEPKLSCPIKINQRNTSKNFDPIEESY